MNIFYTIISIPKIKTSKTPIMVYGV